MAKIRLEVQKDGSVRVYARGASRNHSLRGFDKVYHGRYEMKQKLAQDIDAHHKMLRQQTDS